MRAAACHHGPVGATRMLRFGRDADYLEPEAMLMAFVDDVRVTAFAIVTLCGSANAWYDPEGDLTVDDVAAMYADFVAGMVRAPMRVE